MGTANYPIAYLDTQNAIVYSGVWSGRPSAVTSGAGARMIATDLNYAALVSDGTNWRTTNNIVLVNSAVPVVLLSSATNITTTGAITGLTTLPYVPTGVVRVFCFAQTGLTAGLYYAIFSSTTACQLFELVSSNPAVPGTTMPSGITAGAYTGGTTESTLLSVTVPGGLLGTNGRLRIAPQYSAAPNNANSKTVSGRLGGTLVNIFPSLTSLLSNRGDGMLQNRGTAALQVAGSGSGTHAAYTGSSVSWQQTTVNTATDQTYAISMTIAVATDIAILEACMIEVIV